MSAPKFFPQSVELFYGPDAKERAETRAEGLRAYRDRLARVVKRDLRVFGTSVRVHVVGWRVKP